MQIEKIPIEKINPAEYNPRKQLKEGDAEYEKLKRSIQEFGYVEPLIWNKTTGNLVGGHQRLTVLKDLGYTSAECVVVELNDLKEKALNLALNKIQGQWDDDKLTQLIAELDESAFDVSLTGFETEEIEDLLAQTYASAAVEDKFDAEEEHKKIINNGGPVTKCGDIWMLGKHRLLCGDSTQAADMDLLMGKSRAQVAVTSPPLLSKKEYQANGIEAWLKSMKSVVCNLSKVAEVICWNMSDLYNTGSQFIEPTAVHTMNFFEEAGMRPLWIRIWRKMRIDKTPAAYATSTKPLPQFDYVSAFGTKADIEYADEEYEWLSAYAGHSYKFVKRLTKEERKKWGYAGIWEMNAPKSSRQELTIPVELPWRCIKMHCDRGGTVLEPFCGSGTTLIAAEQTGRVCLAIEKDPSYCDLTVKRWEEFTGEKAVLYA